VRVLVTNDDGITSPGLHALAVAVANAGHDVVVAAPLDNMSGSSASVGYLGQGSRIKVDSVELDGLAAVPAYGVDGPPGLVVLLNAMGAFGGAAQLVVSGINPGWNTGRSVLHSGTVGAALTASQRGVSGVAVSIDEAPVTHWETAAHLGALVLEWLLEAPSGTVVNLNVPDVPLDDVRGVRPAELAGLPAVQTTVVHSGDGYLDLAWTVTDTMLPDHTDTGLVQAGFAAVTLLNGVREADWHDPSHPRPVEEHLERHLRLAPMGPGAL